MRPPADVQRGEAWLAELWQRQGFKGRRLRCTDGRTVQVVYPGRQPGGPGPDFRQAILALANGSLLRGDVELHLHERGWYEHGHHADPTYDEVVLHAVLDAGGGTRNSRGQPVLTVALRPHLAEPHAPRSPVEGPCASQLSYVLAPCKRALAHARPQALAATLRRMALDRFEAKQAHFEGELAVAAPEQALYAGLLEALGYSRNCPPFRQLARSVPLAALQSAASSPSAAAGIEALLREAAGLTTPHSTQGSALDRAGLMPPSQAPQGWQTAGVRPDNLPAARIRQFSASLARLLPAGLLDELLSPLADSAGQGAAAAAALRDEWRAALHAVGPQRADAMAINVLLPFAAAYGQATCQFGLFEKARDAFLSFPAQGANQATTYMRREILGPAVTLLHGAAGEQALLRVWNGWCREKICALCPLGRSSGQGMASGS